MNNEEIELEYIDLEQAGRMNRSFDYCPNFYFLGVAFGESI